MTTVAWCWLAVAATLVAGDWVAVGGRLHRVRLEYVCKPGALLAFLALGLALVPVDPSRRAWFVVALMFCLVGDVALMLPSDSMASFGGGLAAFLVAQLCLLVGLLQHGGGVRATVIAVVVLLAAAALPARTVLTSIARTGPPWLRWPIALYMGALVLMAGSAVAAGLGDSPLGPNVAVAVGGVAFLVSDTLLAWNRFVRPLPRATLLVHATYHVAIALLVLSLTIGTPVP